jgi:hypothetical protein
VVSGEGVAKVVGAEPKVIDAEKSNSVMRTICTFRRRAPSVNWVIAYLVSTASH